MSRHPLSIPPRPTVEEALSLLVSSTEMDFPESNDQTRSTLLLSRTPRAKVALELSCIPEPSARTCIGGHVIDAQRNSWCAGLMGRLKGESLMVIGAQYRAIKKCGVS